jgi:thiol-disulfide isomerase/thioredoxin
VRRRRAARPVALLATGVLALTGLSACGGSGLSSSEAGFVTSDLSIEVLPADQRQEPRGVVAGETVDGKAVSLSDHAGKVVVMPIWGSWCGPCRKEAPGLALASRDLADQGVVILGINSRDRNEVAVRKFTERFDLPYDSIFDEDGRTLLAFRGTLPPMSIPSFVFIDAEGRVAARILGPAELSTIYGVLEDLTGKKLPVPRAEA